MKLALFQEPFRMAGVTALLMIAVLAIGSEQRRFLDVRRAALSTAEATAAGIGSSLILPDGEDFGLLDSDLARIASAMQVQRVAIHRPTDIPGQLQTVADSLKIDSTGSLVNASNDSSWVLGLHESVAARSGQVAIGHAPIYDDLGRVAGVVTIEISIPEDQSRVLWYTVIISMLSVGGLVLLLRQGTMNSRTLGLPSTPPIPPVDLGPGLGSFGARLQGLAQNVQEREYIRETFGRYVSARVAEALADSAAMGVEGEERQVTVVSGKFHLEKTSPIEISPTQWLAILNEIASVASEVVDAHGGYLQSVEGGVFVAVFGTPARLAEHAERGLRCAMALRQQVGERLREWEKCGNGRMGALRLGIASGKVVAGNVGGSARIHYAAVGRPVDEARELMTVAEEFGATLLFSNTVQEALPETVPPGTDLGTRVIFGETVRLLSA